MNWQMTNEKGNAKESSKVSPCDGKQLIVKKKKSIYDSETQNVRLVTRN